MRNMKFYLFLLATLFSAQTYAQMGTTQHYKNISGFDLRDFINMDQGLMGYLPKKSDFDNALTRLKLVPIDSLRYIDSLDIETNSTDTLIVKVYSQNYAYASQNSYKIGKNKNPDSDTLMIYNINVDLKIKPIIENAETFRMKDFRLTVSEQPLENVRSGQRILFTKDFY